MYPTLIDSVEIKQTSRNHTLTSCLSSPSATVDTFIDGREILLNVDKILDDKQT